MTNNGDVTISNGANVCINHAGVVILNGTINIEEGTTCLYANDDTADARTIAALALMKGQITSLSKYNYEGILEDCTSLYGGEGAYDYYIPASLRPVPALMAAHELDLAPYENKTTVTTVCLDGRLRIGVKADSNNIWSFFDNFSLYRVDDKYMERDELNYQIECYITSANGAIGMIQDADLKSLLANAVQQGEHALDINDREAKLSALKALKQAIEETDKATGLDKVDEGEQSSKVAVISIFSPAGTQTKYFQKGIHIIRHSDGMVKKVFTR
ncbi:MAG: hypothetical protein IKG99_10050 [Bacteroidaceae bacterium]|nr:hypothetical protein [Bacteroidaceae bacterium]